MRLAKEIKERHDATPYGFYFETKSNTKPNKTSNFYYLGGKVETYGDVVLRNDPNEETLRWNMQHNNIERIIINTNSWKFTAELKDTDVVLQWEK